VRGCPDLDVAAAHPRPAASRDRGPQHDRRREEVAPRQPRVDAATLIETAGASCMHRPARSQGCFESISRNKMRQGCVLRLIQAWLVACWITTSPALTCTSASWRILSISPDKITA